MKISLNALKKYVNINIPVAELLTLIGSRLVEIEEAIDLSQKYKNIKIVKVAECEKIAGTHLTLCQIDAGEKDLIQVVCGAPNVHRGMLAVWLAPGTIVPSTFGNENFKLDTRKLRGFESNGMLAAADELDLWADHEGILEINPKDAKPGDSFAEIFDLNDIILDIENKSLTHRPDCFGLIGFAREVAGILGQKFKEPAFLFEEKVFPAGFLVEKSGHLVAKDSKISINITDPEICPRYTCSVLEFDEKYLSQSRYLTRDDIFLCKAGMRPVSPIVDMTNILMLETGQPLHAFDYDKFIAVGGTSGPKIIVRTAQDQEKLQLLDGKTIDLNSNDILITSNNIPVALAGAMGGKNTEIDASTKKIILESATFSLYNLRKTQMAHGIFSEAITRFTKGQPASETFNVLAEAINRLKANICDFSDNWIVGPKLNIIHITPKEINALLGTNYSKSTIKKCLENVSFMIEEKDGELAIVVPPSRTDIHIKEDIIEEVGRLLGYDNIPLSFPSRPFAESQIDNVLSLKASLRTILSDQLGANELLTYSFVSEKLLDKFNLSPDNTYKIINSISPELQRFRPSLLPSLVEKVRDNSKSGHADFTLYEINQISQKDFGLDEDNVPIVKTSLAITTFGDFYCAKHLLSMLAAKLGINFDLITIEKHPYYEPLHSAAVLIDGQLVGYVGEIKSVILKNFKIQDCLAAIEINLEPLAAQDRAEHHTVSLSKFPSVARDITVKVGADISFTSVEKIINDNLASESLIYTISPVSIYQSQDDSSTKNLSFHLSFSNPDKTLESQEISAIMERINKQLSKTLGAEVV